MGVVDGRGATLTLLDCDFPDRDAMMGIAEYNLREVLVFLSADDS